MIVAGLQIVLAVAIAAAPGADEHLLAGASAFRDGRFDAALVELRVAEKLGAREAGAYAAAALVKLGRPEEAIEAFASSPAGDDELLDWYRALACYDARLYTCASRLAASLGSPGPRTASTVAKLRAELARVLAPEPERSAVDWYLARCEERGAQGRTALAAAYCREAADLAARRPDRHGLARATAELARLAPTTVSGVKP